MKTTVKLATAVLIVLPLVGIAQQKPLSCSRDIVFSQEFLAKYPRAGAACNEVLAVNGQKWARFNAEVKHIEGTQLNVDFINNEDRSVNTNMTFQFTPDATVTLTDRQVKPASALKEGDKIVFWVPESRFGFYAKPGAAESQQFKVVSE
jgi:hypothetical protein